METGLLLGLGLLAGVAAGLFGIGGGLIIVPFLILVMKLNAREAFGTSLAAIIPPVGLLGVMEYYRAGAINIRYAALIAVGMVIGAYFGAKVMLSLPGDAVKKAYGVFLIVIGARFLLFK